MKRNGLEESEIVGKFKGVIREGMNVILIEEYMIKYCKWINWYDKDKDGNIMMMEFVGYVYYIMRMFVCISDLWIVYEILFFEGVCVVMYENCIKVNWI